MRRLSRPVAVLATIVLLATGCRESDSVTLSTFEGDIAPTAGFMNAVVDRLDEANTARMEFVMRIISTDLPETIEVTGSGAFDAVTGASTFSFDFSALAEAVKGQPGGDVFAEFFEGPFEMRTDGQTAYLRWRFLVMLGVPEGKWLEASVDELSDNEGLSGGLPGGGDLGSLADSLRAAGDVTELGRETIDGVETTHFRVDLSRDFIAESVPADQREDIERSFDQLGVDALPMEVWVSDDALLRRMRMTLDAESFDPGLSGGADGSIEMQIDLGDYGKPIDVELPDPADVVGEDELNTPFGGFGEIVDDDD